MDVVFLQNVNELRERRRDVNAFFVFDALHALTQHFLDDQRQVVTRRRVLYLVQVHEHGHKRRLAVGRHERDNLVLDGLHAFFDFAAYAHFRHFIGFFLGVLHAHGVELFAHFPARLVARHLHEWRQVGQGDALTAVLGAGHLGDDLRRHVAGGREAVRLFDHRFRDDGAVLEHVLQIDEAAVVHVLGEVVRIVEVNDSLVVGFHDFRRQQEPLRDVLGHLAGHVVALDAVDKRVFVGVFLLDFLVVALEQRHDLLVGGICLPNERPLVPICDIIVRDCEIAVTHDFVFDEVLDFLDAWTAGKILAFFGDNVRDGLHFEFVHLHVRGRVAGLPNGVFYFRDVKNNFFSTSFDHFHRMFSFDRLSLGNK